MRTRWLGLCLLPWCVVACDLGDAGVGAGGDGMEQGAVTRGDAQVPGDDFDDDVVNLIDAGDRVDAGNDGGSAATGDCTPSEERACYDGDAIHAGVGACARGTQLCKGEDVGSWSECQDAVLPEPELCINAIDDDCDGETDEGCECGPGDTRACYTGAAGTEGIGECHAGTQTCARQADGDGASWGPCVGQVVPSETMCDGLDRACTGNPGAGCDCTVDEERACYTGTAETRNVGVCHDGVRTCESNDGVVAWGAACAGQVLPSTEVCGNAIDEDCDGSLENGCASLECPDYVETRAGATTRLQVNARGIQNLQWDMLDAPLGGQETASWIVDASDASRGDLTPIIVGDYTVQVSGVDAENVTHECSFALTALPHGLRVQLYWDGAGDLDLHLHDDSRNPWFSDSDCYFSTGTTTWGAVHDLDAVSDGPESLHMDAPAIGVPYTIGVHHYGSAAGRIGLVQVYCGTTGGSEPTQSLQSRPLTGADYGTCNENDFWTVARVTFTSEEECTIERIDTYRAASVVCAEP